MIKVATISEETERHMPIRKERSGRRAALWTLSICAAGVLLTAILSLFPSDDDASESLPALSATNDEALIFVAYIALLTALLYVVLYVGFRLQAKRRDSRER